jgi:hypothetical protein
VARRSRPRTAWNGAVNDDDGKRSLMHRVAVASAAPPELTATGTS